MQCEILPLKTLGELISWQAPCSNYRVEKLRGRKPVRKDYPRTLVCHDMKGGYLEDRWIHGVQDSKCYRFYHWYLIDKFVYFSHYLVTIPPVSWINASHRNGVPILGTFITEWVEGFQTCQELLNSGDTIFAVAEKLVYIAKVYDFDGWLLNIENKLKPETIPKLIKFIKILTKMMHIANPNSTVIWYDSVVCSGELKWQNALNAYNKCFFNACDGFFVNYTWSEDHLKSTVKAAGDRILDVYVGIDVFGRNCYGGGGFNTRAALEIVRNHGLSAAIFAQGWVYECLDVEDFQKNEDKFWEKLVDLCNWNAISDLPLKTNFCQGLGDKMFHQGSCRGTDTWHDMNLQQIQPVISCRTPTNCKMEIHTDEAYIGRSSLRFEGKTEEEQLFVEFLLFFTSFKMSARNPGLLQLSYVHKSLDVQDFRGMSEPTVVLKLSTEDKDILLLFPQGKENVMLSQQYYTSVQQNDETTGWITRTFKIIPSAILEIVDGKDFTIEEVRVQISPSEKTERTFSLLLGYFSMELIEDKAALRSFKYEITCIDRILEPGAERLSCYLEWESSIDADFWTVEWVNKNGEKPYYRTTSQMFFHVNNLEFNNNDIHVLDGYYIFQFLITSHVIDVNRACCESHEVTVQVPVEE